MGVIEDIKGFTTTEMTCRAFLIATPKLSEWKFIGDNLFRCNACGYIADTKWLEDWKQKTTDPIFPKFCPNCAAMMKQSTE